MGDFKVPKDMDTNAMEEEEDGGEEMEDMMNQDSSDDDEDDEEEDEEEDEDENVQTYVPGSVPLEEGTELVMDEGSYLIYHQASLGPPCLSFDVINDPKINSGNIFDSSSSSPICLYGVAGTQSAKVNANSIITYKMFNLHPVDHTAADKDDDEDDTQPEEEDPEKLPKLKIASLKHPGVVNRIRFTTLGGNAAVAAAWSDTGTVAIWNLETCLKKLETPQQGKEWFRDPNPKPLHSFKGHMTEGYALDWCPTSVGLLASGDCSKNIHVWKPTDGGTWSVDQRPLCDHSASVEDLQWSPNETNVLASCSVDKSIKIWDIRAKPSNACMLSVADAHSADVNVIHWNRNEPFIASGGDDGALKIWDLRQLSSGKAVATFGHHKGPVTSVEWHPSDSTVLASSGADDQIALWDLAIEKDAEESSNLTEGLDELPPQLLFIHQGLQDVKELHWHQQFPGLVMATSHTGFDVFRTISV